MPISRRASLLALLATTAACGGRESPPPPPSGPPSYGYLTPLRLAVGRIEVVPPVDPAITRAMPPAPLLPSVVVETMARDRLSAGGGAGFARFTTLAATLTREGAAAGGTFSAATERLTCVMRCRIEVVGEDGLQLGFAEAQVRRTATRPSGSAAERASAADQIVRETGDDLNVEFEYQLRRNLRAMVQVPAPPGAALPVPVEEETLPRT